jgi:hypothetical protein
MISIGNGTRIVLATWGRIVMRRRQKSAWLGLLALLWVPLAHAQKVTVEYDKKADFTQYKTYSWMKLGVGFHPNVQADTAAAIDQQLQAKGLKHMESGGDLLVNMNGSLSEGMNAVYDADVYAMPGLDEPITWAANGDSPLAGSSTVVYVDKGTLVVDLVDRRAKQLKWRGTAKANLDPEQQEKSLEIIEKAVAKLFRDYPRHR